LVTGVDRRFVEAANEELKMTDPPYEVGLHISIEAPTDGAVGRRLANREWVATALPKDQPPDDPEQLLSELVEILIEPAPHQYEIGPTYQLRGEGSRRSHLVLHVELFAEPVFVEIPPGGRFPSADFTPWAETRLHAVRDLRPGAKPIDEVTEADALIAELSRRVPRNAWRPLQ